MSNQQIRAAILAKTGNHPIVAVWGDAHWARVKHGSEEITCTSWNPDEPLRMLAQKLGINWSEKQ